MDFYRVEITETALAEALAYVDYIRKQSHDDIPGQLWFRGLVDAVESLERLSARCKLIREKGVHALPVRQLVYASHRIMFCIEPGLVTILRVYHGSRRKLRAQSRKRPADKL